MFQPNPDVPPAPLLPWVDLTAREKYRINRARSEWRSKHPVEALKDFTFRFRRLRLAMGMAIMGKPLYYKVLARQFGVELKTIYRWANGYGFLPAAKHFNTLMELEYMNRHLIDKLDPASFGKEEDGNGRRKGTSPAI